MKIPETSANVGAYYGNEENGQWQPNGLIIDSGVGGGVVGSGDAGVHRTPPVYPVHIPRGHIPGGHIPGYVMAGAYYPASGPGYPPPAHVPDDFADYMWMENEEEFDKQVMQQLEEEALMEQCIEAMLEDEQRERRSPRDPNQTPTTSNGVSSLSLEETVSKSKLNPLAAEFVPTRKPPPSIAEKPEPVDVTASDKLKRPQESDKVEKQKRPQESEKEEVESPSDSPQTNSETPVVSAISSVVIEKKKDSPTPPVKVKTEAKKAGKQETVKAKPTKAAAVTAKSDTKVVVQQQARKKEIKPVKSEGNVEDRCEDAPAQTVPASTVTVPEVPKPLPTPVEEPKETNSTGFKPINYAAAAKATKPKPKATSPTDDKQPPVTAAPGSKPAARSTATGKDNSKLAKEKLPQRKNSAK